MDASYFSTLAKAIHHAGLAHPVLIVDRERLNHNSDQLARIKQHHKAIRLVAKSLPSVPMLAYLMQRMETNRLMCFHLPFLMHLIERLPEADILIGKPMPANAVACFYRWLDQRQTAFSATQQLQWLVDSEQRLQEYEALAKSLNRSLRVNLEVDIGLHRGGLSCLKSFKRCLQALQQSEHLCFSGIMGYEAHITKIPGFLGGPKKAEKIAKHRYEAFVSIIDSVFGDAQQYCLNTGGSTTYPLYTEQDACNEVATASALVKPSDFDVYTLQSHQPAAFIATPVLKTVPHPELPLARKLSALMRLAGQLPRKAVFIYGGNWLAKPCHPESSSKVTRFGASSNQEMYSVPENTLLEPDDLMFFRPSQSEAVMLQFGQIAVYEQGQIVDWWQTFQYPDSLYNTVLHAQ